MLSTKNKSIAKKARKKLKVLLNNKYKDDISDDLNKESDYNTELFKDDETYNDIKSYKPLNNNLSYINIFGDRSSSNKRTKNQVLINDDSTNVMKIPPPLLQ
jgi:hypothetical protein